MIHNLTVCKGLKLGIKVLEKALWSGQEKNQNTHSKRVSSRAQRRTMVTSSCFQHPGLVRG